MYLFNNHEDGQTAQKIMSLGGSALPDERFKPIWLNVLTGEENPSTMAGLLLMLVVLLHVWGALWLLQPEPEPTTLAKPLVMEVSLMTAPSQKPIAAAPAPAKPPEPVKPKKKPVKPPVKIKKPLIRSHEPLPKPEITAKEQPAVKTAEQAAPPKNEAAASSTPDKSASPAKTSPEPYKEASFTANYRSNPKPKYPAIASSRGWEGKVLLRVRVSAAGFSESVAVERSSGHEVLDDAAVAAVQKWTFTPAKRGNTAVASSVIVPITFNLNQ